MPDGDADVKKAVAAMKKAWAKGEAPGAMTMWAPGADSPTMTYPDTKVVLHGPDGPKPVEPTMQEPTVVLEDGTKLKASELEPGPLKEAVKAMTFAEAYGMGPAHMGAMAANIEQVKAALDGGGAVITAQQYDFAETEKKLLAMMKDNDADKVLEKLNIPSPLLDGVMVAGHDEHLTFGLEGETTSVGVSIGAQGAILSGTATTALRSFMQHNIIKALKELRAAAKMGVSVKKQMTKMDEAVMEQPKVGHSVVQQLVAAGALQPGVGLSMSNKLYQPVKGTDESSCYFVVAISDVVHVAARWKDDLLSIRVAHCVTDNGELPDMPPGYASNYLSAAGFDNKGAHWSMHLSIPQDQLLLAKKTLGAMLAAIEPPSCWKATGGTEAIRGKGA